LFRELAKAIDRPELVQAACREAIALASDRQKWLVYCVTIEHAEHVTAELQSLGVACALITGETPKKERERILSDFKAGRLRALTNANVLTTGFDYPDIDVVVMMRPTMSASLYVQMAGRGMRVKSHTDHCLVLDFAGVVETHGPITNVQPPKKSAGDGEGEAPVKVCDACGELVHISAMTCPACGAAFPEPAKKAMVLRNDDIMGLEGKELEVSAWAWREHTSKASGKQMLAVTYYGGLSDAPITEYLPILHEGYAGQRAMSQLVSMANSASIVDGGLNVQTMIEMVQNLNNATPPKLIEFRKDGKFFRVMKRSWE
jgi:DNA repair protein RadD